MKSEPPTIQKILIAKIQSALLPLAIAICFIDLVIDDWIQQLTMET